MCYINLEIGVIDNKREKKIIINNYQLSDFFFLSNGSFCIMVQKKNQDNRQFSDGFAI